ncbi:homeobox domain-containing protein [Trichoderma citrinoviride]|uniref:Homeobox domain-containing protein n=1 Tax=Trichoderma citrinoviride TaxID=58853 RepID=A0A2T4B7T0_9HYPO|nr:homeobox domain-containing protein [Trichoderma citrinoviride]PTB65386.1 homeobox domain-containing protein [Trichoderma citrinoviride]
MPHQHSQSDWSAWTYSVAPTDDFAAQYTQLPVPEYPFLADTMKAYQVQHNHLVHHQQMSRTTESKPRLSKEEVEVLEAEFQKNHKPNSSTKKALAESMRVDHARINNWFQNRRAREKKENNIREYEARQRAEKERAGGEIGLQGSDRKRDRVASSAPFPEPRQASRAKEQSPDAPSQLSTASEGSTDVYEATPPVTPHLGSASSLVFRRADAEDDAESPEKSVRGYSSSPVTGMSFANVSALDALFSIEQHGADEFGDEYQDMDLARITAFLHQTGLPNSPDRQLRSPCPTDIASRRNRQTPQLSFNGSRSFSGSLRVADAARRSEQVGSMRRVVSTSATGRVRKSSLSAATPRSPFFQRNRSPMGPGSAAPPTPNTPVVTEPQNANGGLFPLTTKYSSSALMQDPTLRTPPTTPAFLENFVFNNQGASYTMGNFGARSFSDQLDASVHRTAAEYDAGITACSSQPTTPMFPYQVGSGYFPGYADGSDYNWAFSSNNGEPSSDFAIPYASSMSML